MLDKLLEFKNKTPSNLLAQRLKKDKVLYDWIIENTKDFDETYTIPQRILILLSGFTINDTQCGISGKRKRYISKKQKFGYCGGSDSCECARKRSSEVHTGKTISEEFKEKRKKTNLERYGVENVLRTPENIAKAEAARQHMDRKISKKKLFTKGFENLSELLYGENIVPNFTLDEYLGSNKNRLYEWKCTKCNHIFNKKIDYGNLPVCKVCKPVLVGSSSGERELANFVSSLGVKISTRRKNIIDGEIDIFLDDFNIGIEYNGLYWHSLNFNKETNYHLKKTLSARANNIKLYHVFENEWISNKNLVQDLIEDIIMSKKNLPKYNLTNMGDCVVIEDYDYINQKLLDELDIQYPDKNKI